MKRLFVIATIVMLSGCQSLNQKFAAAYGTNTLTRKMSTELLDANKLSSAEGEKIKIINDQARLGLDAAWNIRKVQSDSSKTILSKINGTLDAVLQLLEKQEASK